MSYRLAVYVQREHFAEVTIELEAGECIDNRGIGVEVTDQAFDWRRTVYRTGRVDDPIFREAAIRGTRYALGHTAAQDRSGWRRVIIHRIYAHLAHGDEDDVAYAAAQAAWKALGVRPAEEPWIDESGVHFP